MSEALILVDYTNDFVAEDGRLTCGERGRSIEASITNLAKTFIESGIYTVFAVDAHEEGDTFHPEADLFPPHNIIGTKGRNLYGLLGDYVENAAGGYYWMNKTRYSAFAGTDLELKLRERRITTLHLAGVCTDICVLHTAVDAFNKGFNIVIHADAVESFNPEGHEWALEHFKNTLGAEIRGESS
ncbi:cysteine hydrolase family protein [Alkalicoccus luteus]|uniref:Cysteine hydrolase n=1 Tax=Alkalicoccus luteus TaxID=1237094 RepID=A0A969TVZ0_9BACI|nr:isochorismatase family cysteine hydrolase [Alkalicoccus luteus]NJP38890.1 cysteine hydrolase [Alkalicoccus luteus]